MVRQQMGKIYRFRQGWLVHYQVNGILLGDMTMTCMLACTLLC